MTVPTYIWTDERTEALLDQLESRPKYLNAFLGARSFVAKSKKYARRLCIKLLQGTEWMSVMQARGWVKRDEKGRIRITELWRDHEDPVWTRLAALDKEYDGVHHGLGRQAGADSFPALLGPGSVEISLPSVPNPRERPVLLHLHRLKQRVQGKILPTPPSSASPGNGSSRAMNSTEEITVIEDDDDDEDGDRRAEEEHEDNDNDNDDDDDEIVCIGVRGFDSVLHPLHKRMAAVPSRQHQSQQNPLSVSLEIDSPLPVKISDRRLAYETPLAREVNPSQKSRLCFNQDTQTPTATQAHLSPTLLHTYAATTRKRTYSAMTPSIKISDSSRKVQRRGAYRHEESESDPEGTDSDSESETQSTPRDAIPREQMVGMLSFTSDQQLAGMFSDPTIRPQQPWRARLVGEVLVTPPASRTKQAGCPATGGSMDMDIIEDDENEDQAGLISGVNKPILHHPIKMSIPAPAPTQHLVPATPIANTMAKSALTHWFRPDTPAMPSPLAKVAITADTAITPPVEQSGSTPSLSDRTGQPRDAGGKCGRLTENQEISVPHPDRTVKGSDNPEDSPAWQLASVSIDILLAQLRAKPNRCLMGSHVCFTNGDIPFRARLVELVGFLGGRSNSFDETYHTMTPKAPRAQRYFVYPIGQTPGPKAIEGLNQLDVLAFLALVQQKLSQQ